MRYRLFLSTGTQVVTIEEYDLSDLYYRIAKNDLIPCVTLELQADDRLEWEVLGGHVVMARPVKKLSV